MVHKTKTKVFINTILRFFQGSKKTQLLLASVGRVEQDKFIFEKYRFRKVRVE